MANPPSIIKQITYASEHPGPKFLVLGGVHGNETCGPIAIRRIIDEFESGVLRLERGEVTFVPVCNPEAARQGVRFIERNLNRFLVPTNNPTTYEARLGNILCPLLARCDVLLDLHAYTSGDLPFVFVDQNENPVERAFAMALGPEHMVTGWESAHAASGRKGPENPDEPTGTTEYARRFGAIAATLECGQLEDPEAPEIAYTAICNALVHLGLTNGEIVSAEKKRLVTVKNVIYKKRSGNFAKEWKNLVPVDGGELIGIYDDGEAVVAAEDGFIIMPNNDPDALTGWYYFGV